MAENKIKVNELQTATPQLSDTLLASGAEREYACRISDLKDAIGGGGGGGDWNANEGEEGYIANRTHWVETGDSITGTFTLTQEDIEQEEIEIQNSPIAEEVFNIFKNETNLNTDIILNNKTYNVNISEHFNYISIAAEDMSFELECYEEESEFVFYDFSPNIFIVGENTLAIPYDIFHKIDARYIEDTLLWQRGSGNQSVKTNSCTASGMASHAEGNNTTASGGASHAEGIGTAASGDGSHVEGYQTKASGIDSHAEGESTTASGDSSHAEGIGTTASGMASHAEGHGTTANHAHQHVFGAFNIEDPSSASSQDHGTYVEIVGNGASKNNKSNARTLDWFGNEEIAGRFLAKGGILLKSPDGSTFTLTVGNDGTLTATKNT